VQVDEPYVGRNPPSKQHRPGNRDQKRKTGGGTDKIPVLALVVRYTNINAPRFCYDAEMAKKLRNRNPNGRKGNPISAAPLTMGRLVDGMFKIKATDVKRIVASNAGKRSNSK
jgi:hypothetical protein